MRLTKNYTLEELTASAIAQRLRLSNEPSLQVQDKLRKLCVNILQPLRDEYGKAIVVSSGYRCEALNKAVGGAVNSDHRYGCAADIHSASNVPADNRELFELAVRMMHEGRLKEVKQIIDEYNYRWIHISYQDGRSLKRNQILHLK